MRILITMPDVTLWYPGGVENYYLKLRPFWRSEVDYFTVGRRAQRSRVWLRAIRLFVDYWKFFFALKNCGHDVIILNPSFKMDTIMREAIFLLLAKIKNKHVIVFLRGWDSNFENVIRRYGRSLYCRIYGRADATIVLAAEFRNTLAQWGLQKPIIVESTVVEEKAISEPSPRPSHARAEADGSCRILFLSRIIKTKGLYEALDAYRLVRSSHSGVTLTIAGDGPELESAKQYVQSRKISGVAFPGYIRGAERCGAYEQADIFLLPTYHGEGMPNSVLEAMYFGLPVVTRPVGGINDFFQDGVMGFITESRDPAKFAELIERLVADPRLRARVGMHNRSYAQKHFLTSKVVVRLEAICANVLSGNAEVQPQAWYEC